MQKKRVGVLISGRGSNLRALLEASRDPAYPAEIVFVASNNPDAAGLVYASEQGIMTATVNHRDFTTSSCSVTSCSVFRGPYQKEKSFASMALVDTASSGTVIRIAR